MSQICGYYSITADSKYEESTSSLRYFKQPELPIDLKAGIDDPKLRPYTPVLGKLEQFLKYIVNHKSEFVNNNATEALIPCAQFITYDGALRRMICSCNAQRPWTLVATKYKGNIYLCEYTPPEEIESAKLAHALGHPPTRTFKRSLIFRHYCLSDHPNERPEASKPQRQVHILETYPPNLKRSLMMIPSLPEQRDPSQFRIAGKQFFCIFNRNLLDRQFLFAATIHGTDSSTPLDAKKPTEWKANQFVELKAIDIPRRAYRMSCLEDEAAHNAWARCYLTGIENVYFGILGHPSFCRPKITEVRCFTFGELEKISRRNWADRMEGLQFFDYFLKRVEDDLKDLNCPYTTVKYHQALKDRSEPIDYHCEEAAKRLTATVNEGRSKYTFLPEWYLQAMETATNQK